MVRSSIERFNKTLKEECIVHVGASLDLKAFCKELRLFTTWYNEYRPHESLESRTPNEAFDQVEIPATVLPRFEIRQDWPEDSGCAAPLAPIKGKPGVKPIMEIGFLEERRHLPVINFVLPGKDMSSRPEKTA